MNRTFFKKQTSQERLEATSNFIDELKDLKKQRSSELAKLKAISKSPLKPIPYVKKPVPSLDQMNQPSFRIDYSSVKRAGVSAVLSPSGKTLRMNLEPLSSKRETLRRGNESHSAINVHELNATWDASPLVIRPTESDSPGKKGMRPQLKPRVRPKEKEGVDKVHESLGSLMFSPKEVHQTMVLGDYNEDEKYRNLLKTHANSIPAWTKYYNSSGELVWKECIVIEYNVFSKKFLIQWKDNSQKTKEVFRSNLIFSEENEGVFSAEREKDFNERIETFASRKFGKLIESRAQKRQDLNFPSTFLNRIMKKSMKVSKKQDIKDKVTADNYLKDADSNFKYTATLNEYYAKYQPEQVSLPAILKKLTTKSVQLEPKRVFEILYTQDEKDLEVEKSCSEIIQVVKVPSHPSKKQKNQSLQIPLNKKNTLDTVVKYRVDREWALPGFSEICTAIEEVLFRRIPVLELKDHKIFYKKITLAMTLGEKLREFPVFGNFFTLPICQPHDWFLLIEEMYRSLETLDTKVFQIGKEYEHIIKSSNIMTFRDSETEILPYLQVLAKRINLYIEDKLKIGIAHSFKMIQEKLTCYVLNPLPQLTDDTLLHEQVILKNIIKSKKGFLEGKVMKEEGIIKKGNLQPLIEIDFVANQEHEDNNNNRDGKDGEKRHKKRMAARNLIYDLENEGENAKKLLRFYWGIKDETCPLSFSEYTEDIKENPITKGILSWVIPDHRCRFEFEPPLTEFEDLFGNIHLKGLEALKKFQKISYQVPYDQLNLQFKFTGLEEDLREFSHFSSSFIVALVQEVCVIPILLEPFGFYLGNKQAYEKEIEELIKKNKFKLILEELECLDKDLRVFELLVPKLYQIKIFLVTFGRFKNKMVEIIKERRHIIVEKCRVYLEKVLENADLIYINASEKLKYTDSSIGEHINLKLYLSSAEHNNTFEELKKLMKTSDHLHEILEKAWFDFKLNLRLHFYQSKIYWREINTMSEDVLKTLASTKQKYANFLKEKNRTLEIELQKFIEVLAGFKSFSDASHYFMNRDFKTLHSQDFMELLEECSKLNDQRKILDLQQISLERIKEQFKVWDYCENLYDSISLFESSQVEILKLQDFIGLFEIGYESLQSSTEYFAEKEDQQQIRGLLESLNAETLKFENHYQIFGQLKSEAFKDYYWQELINIMFKKNEVKPDYKSLTPKDLIKEGLLDYKQEIDILFDEALYEQRLYLESAIILEAITEMPLKWQVLSSPIYGSVRIIQNIEEIIQTLEGMLNECRKLSNIPERFLRMVEKIKGLEDLTKLLAYFFQETMKFQFLLLQTYPFWSNQKFLDSLEPELCNEIGKVIDEFRDDFNPILKHGVSVIIQICGGIEDRLPKTEKGIKMIKSTIEVQFEFSQKIKRAQEIEKYIKDFFDKSRQANPRLYFLDDHQITQIFKAGHDVPLLLKLILDCFQNLKQFKIKQEVGSPINQEEGESKLNSDCFLEGIVTSHDENLCVATPILLPNNSGKLIDVVEKEVQRLLKRNVLQHYMQIGLRDMRMKDVFKILNRKDATAQAYFVITEAIFYFNLSVIVNYINKPALNAEDESIKMVLLKAFYTSRAEMIKEFIEFWADKITKEASYFWSRAIQQEKHFLEILEKLKDLASVDEVCFEYLSLPKVFIEQSQAKFNFDSLLQTGVNHLSTALKNSDEPESIVRSYSMLKPGVYRTEDLEKNIGGFQIVFATLGTKVNYGLEFTNQKDQYYLYPLTEHYMCHLINCASNGSFVALTGNNNHYVQETVHAIANHLGNFKCVIDFSQENSLSMILNKLAGTVMTGSWMILSEFDCANSQCLSVLANYLISLKEAVLSHQEQFQLDHIPIKINTNFNVITLLRNDGSSASEINPVILEHFRVKHLQSPNYVYLFKNALNLVGYETSGDFAVNFSNFLTCISIREDYLDYKFGLDPQLIPYDIARTLAKELIGHAQKGLTDLLENMSDYVYLIVYEYFNKRGWSFDFLKNIEESFDLFLPRNAKFEEIESDEDEEIEEKNMKLLEEALKNLSFDLTDELKEFTLLLYEGLAKHESVLIYGNEDQEAWTSIRIASYMHAIKEELNHHLYRIFIDSSDQRLLYGGFENLASAANKEGRMSSGLLDLVQEAMTGQKFIDNLKGFCKYPAIPMIRTFKENPKYFTLIVDSFCVEANKQDINLTKDVMCKLQHVFQNQNQTTRSRSPRLVFKVKEIHNLGISEIVNTKLYCMPSHSYSLRTEYNAWMRKLIDLNPWFTYFKNELEILKVCLLNPTFAKFLKKAEVLGNLKDKKIFSDFTVYLEMFLNELRKYAITIHAKNVTSIHLDPVFTDADFNTSKGNRRESMRRSSIAQELASPEMEEFSPSKKFTRMMEKKKDLMYRQSFVGESNTVNIPRKGPMSNRDEELFGLLQCIYIQSLLFSVGNMVQEKYKGIFEDFLMNQIQSSAQQFSNRLMSELVSFVSTSREKDKNFSLSNHYFDFARLKWVSFMEYKTTFDKEIVSNFTLEDLPAQEKHRFSQTEILSEIQPRQSIQQMIKSYAAINRINSYTNPYFYESLTKKKSYFLIEHLVSYEKDVFLIGPPQQGKSSLLEFMIKRFSTVKLSMNHLMNKREMLRKVVSNLSGKANVLVPSTDSMLVCIDDVHLQNEETNAFGVMRQIFQSRGCYSFEEYRFKHICNTNFLMACSKRSFENNNINHYLNYWQSPVALYMPEEDKGTTFTIFESHCHLVNLNRQGLEVAEMEKMYLEFLGDFWCYASKKRDLLDKINGLFNLNLSLSKMLEFLHAFNPSVWIPIINTREIRNKLSFGLYTLFQQNVEDLNGLIMTIFEETIFQEIEKQNISLNLSSVTLSSKDVVSVPVWQGSQSLLSPELLSVNSRNRSNKPENSQEESEMASKFSTNYMKELSKRGQCLIVKDEHHHHIEGNLQKLKLVSEEKDIISLINTIKSTLKRYAKRHEKLARRLVFYFYYSLQNISLFLLVNSIFQAYRHSHFLLTEIRDSLFAKDLIEFGVFLNHGVFHDLFGLKGSLKFREVLWNLLEEIITNLWQSKTTNYIYIDLNNFEDELDLMNIVQDLNSLVQQETISCILSPEAMERIINDWRKGEAYKNLGLYEVLIAMKPYIQNHLRIILVPQVGGRFNVENLKEDFLPLMNTIFIINLDPDGTTGICEDEETKRIVQSAFDEEVKVKKLWDNKRFDKFLERHLVAENKTDKRSWEVEKLLCHELITGLSNKYKEISEEILVAVSFYVVYLAKHPQSIKKLGLSKITEFVDLSIQNPFANYFKKVICDASLLESYSFYNNILLNDIFSIRILLNETKIPMLAIWDPQEHLPHELKNLGSIFGCENIISQEEMNSLMTENLQGTNRVLILRDCSEPLIYEKVMEDYYDKILKGMLNLDEKLEGVLKHDFQTIQEAALAHGIKIVFIFTKASLFDIFKFNKISLINLEVCENDESYRESLRNMFANELRTSEKSTEDLKEKLEDMIERVLMIRKSLRAVLELKDAEIKFPEKIFLDILFRKLAQEKESLENDDEVFGQEYQNKVIGSVIQDVSGWMDEKLQKVFHTYYTILMQTRQNSENSELWDIFKKEYPIDEEEYDFENINLCQEWEKNLELFNLYNLYNTNHLSPIKYSLSIEREKNKSTATPINPKESDPTKPVYANSFDEKIEEDEEKSSLSASEESKQTIPTLSPTLEWKRNEAEVLEDKTPESPNARLKIDLNLHKIRSAGPLAENLPSPLVLKFKKAVAETRALVKDRKPGNLALKQRVSSGDKVYLWTPQSPAFRDHSPSGSPFTRQTFNFNNPGLSAFDPINYEHDTHSKVSHKNDSSSQSSLGRGLYRQSSYNIEMIESQEEAVLKKYYNDYNYLNLFERAKQTLLEIRRKVASKFEPFRTVELEVRVQSDLEEMQLDRHFQEIILGLLGEFEPQNQDIVNVAEHHSNELIELLLEENLQSFDFVFSKLEYSPLLFMVLLKITRSGLLSSLCENFTKDFTQKQLVKSETLEEILNAEQNKRPIVLFYEGDYGNIISLIKGFASNLQQEVVKISFLKFKETEIATRIQTCLEENRWVIVEGVCPYSEKRMTKMFGFLEDLERSPFLRNKGRLVILVHQSYSSSFYNRAVRSLNYIHTKNFSSIKELLTSFYMNQFIESCVKATLKRKTLLKSVSAAQVIMPARKTQLKQLLPLVKFLGHLGKTTSKDYTYCAVNKKPAMTSPQPDRVQMDKYSFSLNFILSVFYKRQMIAQRVGIAPEATMVLLYHEIFDVSDVASKIFSEYEIDPEVVMKKVIMRFLGLDSKEKAHSLQRADDVVRYLIREFVNNQGSRPVLLDVVGNKYEFFSPVETLSDIQKSQMVTSVIGRYPEKDPYETMGMTSSSKLAYDFKLTQELYQNLLLLGRSENNLREVENAFLTCLENDFEVEKGKKRVLCKEHQDLKETLFVLQNIYYSISSNLEEISVPESLEEQNVKLSPELLSLANTSRQAGRGRMSLFSQKSHPDLKKSNFNKSVVLSQEVKWMGEYILTEGRHLNIALKKIKDELKDCIQKVERGKLAAGSGIMKNVVPERWAEIGILSTKPETFHEFMKQLFIKYDYISKIMEKNKGIPRLPLNLKQLAKPDHFLYTLLLNYCSKSEVNPKDVVIEMVAMESTQQDEQNKKEANKIIIKGLELYFGGFDPADGQLVEASKVSFLSDLPAFYLSFKKSTKNPGEDEHDEQQISIIIKGFDFDSDCDSESDSEGSSKSSLSKEMKYVKIPMKRNPMIWFYFKSKISQEKWSCNGSYISV